MHAVPTTVVTGFLGSGKTTIISHLIDALQAEGIQVAYIKNEIGDEDLDARLLAGKHIVTRQLLNGCICCTLTGPFVSAIEELVATTHPDRIIIEASGVADPSALALMISAHPRLIRDGVMAVVDVVHFEGYKDLSYAAREQAVFTDLIVFNKVELAPESRKISVVGYVRELNDFAPIVEAPHGRVAPELVFGISQTELDRRLDTKQSAEAGTAGKHHHLTEDRIETIRYESSSGFHRDRVTAVLQSLPPNVLRVKGYLDTNGETVLVNQVGKRLDYVPSAQREPQSVLIFIGFAIGDLADALRKQLDGCIAV